MGDFFLNDNYNLRHQSKFNMHNTFIFISWSCAGSKIYKLKIIESTNRKRNFINYKIHVHVYCMGSGFSCIIPLTFELTNLHAINSDDKKRVLIKVDFFNIACNLK